MGKTIVEKIMAKAAGNPELFLWDLCSPHRRQQEIDFYLFSTVA